MRAPKFWKTRGLKALLLYPVSLIYARFALSRFNRNARYKARLPVLCIGNLVAGGAGKTPTALAIGKAAVKLGLKPIFLTRGYRGKLTGPVMVDLEKHSIADVGDEALLLAQAAPTIVSVDRVAGAKLAESLQSHILIMDDGFQNPYLYKDFNLVAIDAQQAIGNGFVMPAGPLRAPLLPQVRRADQFLVIGEGNSAPKLRQMAARLGKASSHAYFSAEPTSLLEGTRVLALCGIGRPEKFYQTVNSLGLEIVDKYEVADHYAYTNADALQVLHKAKDQNLVVVTTAKDHVRLKSMSGAGEDLARAAKVIEISMAFDDRAFPRLVLEQTQRKFSRR
ncbi:tetraacyldisaccharide 4'-kinase [Cohaesibacter gelatinilyticus]|uniref:Tetraacyldisaccharide 4'-kinase n=1 Tax=Cohaesibacter gelatinilyticus TaxID=372072 RepID=A0A285N8X1_9HYPH|nr:tetraacyldisaccharide 4'-kinase [Cohaesibacter gelatinilyticus]SNZ05860.1 lipid-A-disaccharide kinase [Cohaesibacter gelatinilyticus]HAT86862.1 tetraacyldisaccharide 4'-kinase [Hyphomicrobiales bacterium]